MKKRDFLKTLPLWITPVVTSISLPAHAQTSEVNTTGGDPRDGGDDPVIDPTCIDCEPVPPEGCGRKVEVCHVQPDKQTIDICVAKPAVPAHVRLHGDTVGLCPK